MNPSLPRAILLGAALSACMAGPAIVHAKSCDNLVKAGSPTSTVTFAKAVETGTFEPGGRSATLSKLPPFCRVSVNHKPSPDSDIHSEVWLPISGWNGKLLVRGSGGWGGAIDYEGLADALRLGYAAAATDDGHSDSGGRFVMGHLQKFIDFAYRAEHEMTVAAKALIQDFYGRSPQHSYWQGCSGGGREGLLQAARYPDEFDGVIAGDPANFRRNAWALWLANQTFKDPASRIPPEKYAVAHRAALDACDATDGLKDGLISEPQKCHVDFSAVQCKGADAPDCLTARQVQTAQTIVSPATTAGGQVLFPRLEPGTELRWARLAGGPSPGELFFDQFRYLVYQNPEWDWRTFDLERDAAKANAVNRDVVELDPRLAAFAKRGGKLLMYHGWADQQVAPGSSVEFYESAVKNGGDSSRAGHWARLFMVPGMGHCSGGEGPDEFDSLKVMEQWVERGSTPERIVAAHRTDGKVDRTRPLCAYPKVARYNGAGSVDEESSFECRE